MLWWAGTVVDRVITSPSESDFFLISQAGLQGTSRPTHYHVVLDQNELSQDEIQEFSYQCAASHPTLVSNQSKGLEQSCCTSMSCPEHCGFHLHCAWPSMSPIQPPWAWGLQRFVSHGFVPRSCRGVTLYPWWPVQHVLPVLPLHAVRISVPARLLRAPGCQTRTGAADPERGLRCWLCGLWCLRHRGQRSLSIPSRDAQSCRLLLCSQSHMLVVEDACRAATKSM